MMLEELQTIADPTAQEVVFPHGLELDQQRDAQISLKCYDPLEFWHSVEVIFKASLQNFINDIVVQEFQIDSQKKD